MRIRRALAAETIPADGVGSADVTDADYKPTGESVDLKNDDPAADLPAGTRLQFWHVSGVQTILQAFPGCPDDEPSDESGGA